MVRRCARRRAGRRRAFRLERRCRRRLAIDIEFVSANPTGPLHIGHARQAAYGDALARILEFRGHGVTREYYINDYGSQITRLGESVRALALGEPVPQDGYHGDYVAGLVPPERALKLDLQTLAREACDACLVAIRASLQRFGVNFECGPRSARCTRAEPSSARSRRWRCGGRPSRRTARCGCARPRTATTRIASLVRSNGEHTYFTSDIAYLEDKRERGYDRLVYVWGADHHGYIARMKAVCAALGGDPGEIEIVIQQFVHLLGIEGRTAMSKREGEYVTIDELIDEIGVDASRFFLLARSHDTTVDLDLDLAVRESAENPVYYVQYAHARIASILERAGGARIGEALERARGGRAAASVRARTAALPARLPGRAGRCRGAPRAPPRRLLLT